MPPEEKTVPADDIEVLEGDDTPDKDEEKIDSEDVEKDEEDLEEGEEDEEDEEDKEDEDKEDKDKEDEDLDLGPRRPNFKEVKEKYPNLFKDFPGLRDAFFRESEYTKVFPTIDDAKEAADNLDALSVIQDKVLDGDPSAIFEASKEADPKSYNKLVRGLLPTLYKLDNEAYVRAITPTLESMVRNAYKDGKTTGDEDLTNSALHVSKWFFGTEDVALGKTTTVKADEEESPEAKKLAKERQDFESGKQQDALKIVLSERDSTLGRMISKGLDPDGDLSDYVKDKLVKDVIDRLDHLLLKDKSHMANMNAKWRAAKRDGYSRDSLKGIVTAYQARAKSLIPSVRAKLFDAALGKVSKKHVKRVSDIETRREVPAGRHSSNVQRLPSPKEIDWHTTSDEDILSGKITTRR